MGDRIVNPKIHQLVQRPAEQPSKKTQVEGTEFAELLKQELGLKVSGHAQTRLSSREIKLGAEDWARVKDGVDRAAEKGSRDSLVMVNDVALVISVKNRTIITAVAKNQLKENVFTNIDSAVIV